MIFTAKKSQIADSLQNAAAIAERRQTIPILANIKIKTSRDQVEITATDLEVQLQATISEIAVEEEGEITVSARKMAELCRSLPENQNLKFELLNGKFHVSSSNFNADFATLSANDFPELEVNYERGSLSASSSLIKRLLTKTSFSMASQDVRYYLNGLLLEFTKEGVKAVATDGHRLSLANSEKLDYTGEDLKYILPRKAVLELSKILSSEDEMVEILFSDSHLTIKKPNLIFSSKLIDGKFPDYEKVFPSGKESALIIDKAVLQSALSRSSVLSNEKYRGVRFNLSVNNLKLTANNPEQEMAEEELEVVFSGEPLEIGFNIGYLLDVLNVIETDKIEMLFYGEESSCLLREPDSKTETYVIMPMRL